jgi:hypothetical protein
MKIFFLLYEMAEFEAMISQAERIDRILQWSKGSVRARFNTSFVEKMKQEVAAGPLTIYQDEALNNIIEKWHVPIMPKN